MASKAPIVGVLARLPGRPRWSCVLRWDVKRGRVLEGAWTKLQFKDRACAISPDGEFLMYVGSGRLSGPFSAQVGGGIAVSRLPWLAALTDIRPASVAGGGSSRHALGPSQEARLWSLFEQYPGYYRGEDWPSEFGAGWTRDDADRYPPEDRARWRGSVRLSAHRAVPKRGLRLVVVARRKHRSDGANERVSFYLESTGERGAGLRQIPDIRWAAPTQDGRILVASVDGHLRRLFPAAAGDPHTPLRVEQDHDLSRLRPDPKPAPKGAYAPLTS